MEKDKVSIIVAIYNSERFLTKLINSIVKQTYRNLEIILVDDGSPDRSGEICDKFAKIDKRIIVIHKKNGGTCEARNCGLKVMTGDYFTIVDGDDWLEPDYISYLMGIIYKTGAEMSMSDKIFTTRDRVQVSVDNVEVWSPEKTTEKLIYPGIAIGPWNKIYSTKLVKENGICFDVPWSGEGLYFITAVAQRCSRVGVGHRKVYNYRLNNAGSGLTNYDVQIGKNALWNIKNIKRKLLIKTSNVEYACDWHIWKNYNFLLKLIIGTSIKKNRILYSECLKNIRKRALGVAVHSNIGIKRKIKVIITSIFPKYFAIRSIRRDKIGLERDTME